MRYIAPIRTRLDGARSVTLQAGEILARRLAAMQLTYLGTLLNIADEKSNTIVFPLPIDLAKSLGLGERT